MKFKVLIKRLFFLLVLAGVLNACKRYDNPPPVFEEYGQDTTEQPTRRVLIVSIDGAVGAEVEKIMPATLSELLKTSKYTWEGLSDPNTNDASTWASMVTDVSSNAHHVVDDTFRPHSDNSDPHSDITFYPTFFYRLLENRPDYQTAVISPWDELANTLLVEAGRRIVPSNDISVKDSAVSLLENGDPRLMLVNFRSVLDAGVSAGFSADKEAYRSAIEKVDGYLGEIMTALEQRKEDKMEDWLVIVTSNHGGTEQSYGGASLAERNIFTVFYHPDFLPLELDADLINSVRFHGWDGTGGSTLGVRAQAQDVAGDYNPGSGSMTIEAKVKFNKNANGNYNYFVPPFLSKTENRVGSTIGWSLIRNNENIEFYLADGNAALYIAAKDVGNDGLWHTITAVIEVTGTAYNTKLYIDGLLAAEGTMTGSTPIVSPAPLVLGYWNTVFSNDYVDMSIADVRIWNKELSSSVIKSNVCLSEITEAHPDYTHLVGYWPAQDGGGVFKNSIENKPDFQVSGPYRYSVSSLNSTCETQPQDILIQNIDIAPVLYYWLKIDPAADWGLEGTAFLTDFEVEFIK